VSKQSRQDGLSRRQFLPRAAAVAAAGVAGIAGYELPQRRHPKGKGAEAKPPESESSSAPVGTVTDEVRTFVSRPDLRPPAVRVTTVDADGPVHNSPRFIFSAPRSYFASGPARAGLMIVDRRGRLVYFREITHGQPFDFNVQSYKGRPVLTSWHGDVMSAHGYGSGEITDSSYRRLRRIRAGHGLMTDLHELVMTSAGTALITAYGAVSADLSRFGGPHNGKVFTGHAQEIDLATGKVLFDWNSLDHVGLDESYKKPPSAHGDSGFDYFHINSIAEMDDGDLLICARNTCAMYKVDRSTGRVTWRLGGKRSDFDVAAPARFYWQHHARMHGPYAMTVFDNGGPKKEKQSRALLLAIDQRAKRVDLSKAYVHPAGFMAITKGSMQRLPDGRVFVGWGDQPYFSEFAPDGTLLLHGEFPVGIRSYRAFVGDWVGRPAEPPRVAARRNPASGYVVYASWNGATEVDRWTVLAGADKSALQPVGSQPWTGFETAIAVNSTGPHFAAVALDRHGKILGRSAVA
jgi:hypothetical protein